MVVVIGSHYASFHGIMCAFAYKDSEPSGALPTCKVEEVEEKNQLQVTFQALGMGHVDD